MTTPTRDIETAADLKRALLNARPAGVYFVKCCNFIKIGCSLDVNQRLQTLTYAMPFELQLLAVLPVIAEDVTRIEAQLHRQFAHLRHRGEWFRIGNDLLAHIASIKEAQ